MAEEDFGGYDIGYVPEDLGFPQNLVDEHDVETVIDSSGFPQLLSDDQGADNLVEVLQGAHFPENDFDGYQPDVGGLPEDTEYPQQEHVDEGHDGVGVVTENFDSLQEQGAAAAAAAATDSKGNEIKRWPGWPGESVFRMLVPVQKVGSIIGRKGEFIKKITEETKARIKILDGPPGAPERAVSLIFSFHVVVLCLMDSLGYLLSV